MAPPKGKGIALVLGVPKEAPSPAGPEDMDGSGDYSELASMAFPGVKVNIAALKELIHACLEK